MMYFSCKEGKAVNVYDFDNTIYDGESGFDIFMFYLKKDPKEIAKLIPRFGEAFIRYKRGAIKTDEVIEQYGDMLTDYCVKIKDIHKDITEFWDEHEKKITNFYAKIQAPDDVIVSACPEIILEEICKRIGVKNYIGSVVDMENGIIERVCYKENKIAAFKSIYGDMPIDSFYTDSMSDKPMMDLANNAYLVSGDHIELVKNDGVWLSEPKTGLFK